MEHEENCFVSAPKKLLRPNRAAHLGPFLESQPRGDATQIRPGSAFPDVDSRPTATPAHAKDRGPGCTIFSQEEE